jgi:N-acetylneuraminate synthase
MEEADANLRVLDVLKERYGGHVGYSCHGSSNFIALCAVARGAVAIERHITLSRNLYGSDQAASAEPNELAELVALVQRAERVLGSGIKELCPAELATKAKLRGGI